MGTLTYATPAHRVTTTAIKNGRSDVHSLWQRWRQRARMRAELCSMDERALDDIGLDLETARQEAHRFFWHV